jgi:hypothetical protein
MTWYIFTAKVFIGGCAPLLSASIQSFVQFNSFNRAVTAQNRFRFNYDRQDIRDDITRQERIQKKNCYI